MNYFEDLLSDAFDFMTHNIDHPCKGFIVVDDKTGSKLQFVKKIIDYDYLKKEDKVSEVSIDGTWSELLKKGVDESGGRECWNRLLAAAYDADHARGLLVINISNIEIFGHCWKLKQLAKQETELVAWEPTTREEIAPVDYRFFKGGAIIDIPVKFMFNGYVLLVIDKSISWEDIKQYSEEHNKGDFEAMMQFYRCVRIED